MARTTIRTANTVVCADSRRFSLTTRTRRRILIVPRFMVLLPSCSKLKILPWRPPSKCPLEERFVNIFNLLVQLLFNTLTSYTCNKYVCAAVQCCRGYGGDVEEAAAEGRVEATLHHCAAQQDCWQGHPCGCREESRKLG